MSAFGDSWAREAQFRKRRVDDLMLSSSSSSSSSFKKLSNGKFACIVCPLNPVLDSHLAFSMHAKGSRHVAAGLRIKERELSRKEELNRRIALSSNSIRDSKSSTSINSNECIKRPRIQNQPLIEQTRRAILEAQCSRSWEQKGLKLSTSSNNILEPSKCRISEEPPNNRGEGRVERSGTAGKMLANWNEELCKRREKELKFIEVGWKRDDFGKWYKDEMLNLTRMKKIQMSVLSREMIHSYVAGYIIDPRISYW